MSLRDDLVSVLGKAFRQGIESGGELHPWEALADECIRQMTWVAYEATFSHRASEGYDDKDDALNAAKDFVSLAPEDWKP